MDVRLPDGTIIQNVPDGTTKADLAAKLKSNGMAVPSEWLAPAPEQPKPQASQTIGGMLRDIPRQVGLTARYGIEGLGQMADIATEPIRQLVVNPLARLVGAPEAQMSTGQTASALADRLGLPAPQNADERVVGDAARMVASAGGMAGATGAAARNAPGLAGRVLSSMAARPALQATGAASSGLAGGSVREAGGDELEQFGAALAGGIAGGVSADKIGSAARSGVRAVGNAIERTLRPDAVLQRADQQINLTLQRSGIDWSQVPERIKQSMREDAAQAMANGQPLNAEALQRLLVFRRAGVTPTVGQLTQDPGQITREANLAKVAANSTDASLQRLPALQNTNVQALLRRLDEAGAANAPTASGAGSKAINSLSGVVDRNKNAISDLYSAARDTSGRSLPLEGGTFTRLANQALDEANVGSFLPPDIARKMNGIAKGEIPLTVDVAEQLKTSIGNLQRGSSDGNARHALGLVRQALDETPLIGAEKVNPGNLPAVPGTVPPSAAAAGQESIDAFKAARSANREWMQRVEGNPALKAVVDGVEPDRFVADFVIGGKATAKDVRALAGELDPQARESMRQYLVAYLRDKATGGDRDIAKFGGKTYRDALRGIADKLPAFFSPDEIQHLRDIGDAAKYMQAQPAGSAVNNSNSGALVIGKGLDMLASVSGKLPLGLNDTITGVVQSMQQSRALAPRNALQTLAAPREGLRAMNPLLAITASTPADARENDRGR